jgi:signal transduction histidine kinase
MQQTQQMALEKEAAELANQTKSEFLATMSHELRTPLNAILGYTEILEEEAESDELDHYLEDLQKIRAAGSHLLTMINDVLQLSRMEAGKIDLEPESLSMRSFLTDIVEELGALIRSKENDIDLVCNEATIWFVDAFRLKQIVINLLNNANKFTEKGTITICVEDVQEDGQTWHQLSVKDTGIGMSPDETQRIFEKFTQADASTTRKYGGTGLGLTICKKLAERMDGYITVQSQKGEGSVFSLYLAVTNECEPSSL